MVVFVGTAFDTMLTPFTRSDLRHLIFIMCKTPFDAQNIYLYKTQVKRNYSFLTITILRFSFKKGTLTSCTTIETTFLISFNSASGF